MKKGSSSRGHDSRNNYKSDHRQFEGSNPQMKGTYYIYNPEQPAVDQYQETTDKLIDIVCSSDWLRKSHYEWSLSPPRVNSDGNCIRDAVYRIRKVDSDGESVATDDSRLVKTYNMSWTVSSGTFDDDEDDTSDDESKIPLDRDPNSVCLKCRPILTRRGLLLGTLVYPLLALLTTRPRSCFHPRYRFPARFKHVSPGNSAMLGS